MIPEQISIVVDHTDFIIVARDARDLKWPKVMVLNGKGYTYSNKVEQCPSAQPRAKYLLSQVISLEEQKRHLEPVTLQNISLPFNLEYPPNVLARKRSRLWLGEIRSPHTLNDIINGTNALAVAKGLDMDDLLVTAKMDRITVEYDEVESTEAYIERINAVRKSILEKYFASLVKQARAEQDRMSSERQAYAHFLKLQKRFAEMTPAQISALEKSDD